LHPSERVVACQYTDSELPSRHHRLLSLEHCQPGEDNMSNPDFKTYVVTHFTDLIQIIGNLGIVSWALFKKADNFLINYINTEVARKFFTKEDGSRLENKLDRLIVEVAEEKGKKKK
jgi:hypothetical protein